MDFATALGTRFESKNASELEVNDYAAREGGIIDKRIKTMKKAMVKKKSDKSRLIKKNMEREKAENFIYALGRKDRGTGIYILFSGDVPYYVGMSKTSLRSRLKKHALKDHHRGQWDEFSFYQVPRQQYIKDIETLLIRVIRPPGNKVRGKYKGKYKVTSQL